MISVPLSNAIKFRPVTGQTAKNFDNVFIDDFKGLKKEFVNKIESGTQQVQVVSDTYYGDVNACSLGVVEYVDGWLWSSSLQSVYSIDGLYYYTFLITPDATGCFKLYIVVDESPVVEYYESEWLEVIESESDLIEDSENYHKVEWFNHDNAFSTEYRVSSFVPKLLLESRLTYQGAAGDSIIFDNQGDEVKLKETVQRLMKFDADVPDYMAEILTLAAAHDRFFIDDVEYVTSKKPTVSQLGRSKFYKFELELKQSAVLGLNTHDTGFDCDALTTEDIMNITAVGKTSSFTVDIPENYLLHLITIFWRSGAGADITCGTAVEGTDLMAAQTINSGNNVYTEVIHQPFESATTIYFTIDGTINCDVNVQIIRNNDNI